MNKFLPWLFVCLSGVLMGQASPEYEVRVDGNPTVSARPATRIAGEWFVPLAPVARALGAQLSLDATGQTLRVLRSDGITAIYESASGRIVQGSILSGQVANFRQVQLNTGLDNVMFPVSGVVILFGVSVQEDQDRDILNITSIPPGTPGAGGGSPGFQAASLDDRAGVMATSSIWQPYLAFTNVDLIGSNRLTANIDLTGVPEGRYVRVRQGFVRYDTASHMAIIGGDQGTNTSIEALINTVRGLGYEWRMGGVTANLYAGKAASSTAAGIGFAGLPNYDTDIAGFGLRHRTQTTELAMAGNIFRGPMRNGETVGVTYSGQVWRNEFKFQGLGGYFFGDSLRPVLELVKDPNEVQNLTGVQVVTPTPAGTVIEQDVTSLHVRGAGYGFSLQDTFRPFRRKLLFTALWDRYSRNFLVVREESVYSAVSRKSLSSAFQPFRYINFTGSVHSNTALVGVSDLEHGYSYGADFTIPHTSLQFGYYRANTEQGGPYPVHFNLTQYTFQMPQAGRFSASAIYSQVEFNSEMVRSYTETFGANLRKLGRITLHDQYQPESSHVYGFDWSRQFEKGLYILGGLERETSEVQKPILAPVASLRVPLPHNQKLTMSYIAFGGTKLFQFEIGGPLLGHRELVNLNNQTALLVPASLTGRVYYDANLDGRYDASSDQPIAQLQVFLDDTPVTTDANGLFHFNGVTPGEHRVRAAIATLPANLVFTTEDLIVAVLPYRSNQQDFRAIPTGKITGMVTIVRMNAAGNEVEQPFPDVRIISSSSRDSFSEVDGRYVFGDLPPGQYQLRVDPTTLPPGMIAEPAVRTMPVKPGQTTDGADFRIVRPVINRPAPVMTSVPKPKPPAPQPPAVQPAAAPRAANVGNTGRPSAPLLQAPDLQLHVSEAPAFPQAPLVLAPLGEKKGPAAAPATVSKSNATKPSLSADQLQQKGRELMAQRQFAAAAEMLTQAIELKPNFALALNARGFAYLQLLRLDEARRDFESALQIDPAYANAKQNLDATIRTINQRAAVPARQKESPVADTRTATAGAGQ